MSVSAAGLWRSREWRYRLAVPEHKPARSLPENAPVKVKEIFVFDASKKVENPEKEVVHE